MVSVEAVRQALIKAKIEPTDRLIETVKTWVKNNSFKVTKVRRGRRYFMKVFVHRLNGGSDSRIYRQDSFKTYEISL